jgi:hypothetical protein
VSVVTLKTGTQTTIYTMPGNTAGNYFPKILSVDPMSSHCSECLQVIQNTTLRWKVIVSGTLKSPETNWVSKVDVPTLFPLSKAFCGNEHCHDPNCTYPTKNLISLDECTAVKVLKFESKKISCLFVWNKKFLIKNSFAVKNAHVKWVPRHNGMARSQVADGEEGLQIRRVAANILDKQSRTADKGWPSNLGVEREG